jgi:hypothetical protein
MTAKQKDSCTADISVKYHIKLRYADVISLAMTFGYTATTARSLIEGPDAPVKGLRIGPSTRRKNGKSVKNRPRAYYDRDAIINALQNNQITK